MKLNLKPRAIDFVLLILAFALVGFYVLFAGGGFPLDDSWIHQTYGRNLGTLGEWSFIPGQSSAASTSPLYTLILALGYRLGVDFRLWTHGIGAMTLAITGMIGVRFGEQFGGRRVGIVTGLALVAAWHLIWAAGSGMETAMFGMLTLGLIRFATRSAGQRSFWDGIAFGILGGLTTLARPEGVVLVALFGLKIFLTAENAEDAERKDFGHRIVWMIAALVGFAVLVAPYLIYNWEITGGILPNTAAAKRAQAAALFELPYLSRYVRMLIPLLAGGQILLIPGIVMFAIRAIRERSAARALLLTWGFGLIAIYAAWLPLDMQHGRYVMPALPALIVAGVIGTSELLRAGRKHLITRVATNGLAISTGAIFGILALSFVSVYRQDVAIIDGDMLRAAKWIEENVPTNELLAIHDIGAVGYFAPRPMLDIGGLISPEVIPIIRDGDALWAMLESRRARYLMAYSYQTPHENPNDPRLCLLYVSHNPVTTAAGGTEMMIFRILSEDEPRTSCLESEN
jgi:hypothetical protein